MISDEEKRRIWEEEKYRFEVRRQLEAETPAPIKKSKIWTFLNSPFGIWLLATVLIGVVSWGFTQWEAERAERNAWSSRITKLDAEIESRLDAISDMFGHEEVFMGDFNDTLWGYDHGIYEEFRKRDTQKFNARTCTHRRATPKDECQACGASYERTRRTSN